MRKSAAVVIAASTTVGALLVASPAGAVKPSGGKTFFFSTSDTTNGVTFDEADGTVTVDVNRSSSKGKASVTVQLAPGTADTADVGYAGSDVVRFASGEGTKTIALAIDDDNIVESAESFTLTLSAPSRGYSLDNTRGSVTGSITDDDSVPDPNGIWTLQSGDTISLTDLTLGGCNDLYTSVLASDATGTTLINDLNGCNDPIVESGPLTFTNTGPDPVTVRLVLNDAACGTYYSDGSSTVFDHRWWDHAEVTGTGPWHAAINDGGPFCDNSAQVSEPSSGGNFEADVEVIPNT